MSATTRVLVRPKSSLAATAWASLGLAMIPVFGVLYWFAAVSSAWAFVISLNVLVVLAALGLWWRQVKLFTAVSDTELYGQGIFSPMVRVALGDIAAIHLVETFSGYATETQTQFLAVDAGGKRLFRMRGDFWLPGTLESVADATSARVLRSTDPVSMREFFERFPSAAYWFENRPWLIVAAAAVALGMGVGVAALAAQLLQLPVAGV